MRQGRTAPGPVAAASRPAPKKQAKQRHPFRVLIFILFLVAGCLEAFRRRLDGRVEAELRDGTKLPVSRERARTLRANAR